MLDTPQVYVTPTYIGTWSSRYGCLDKLGSLLTPVPGSITWPSANRAVFSSIFLPFPYTVRRVFWGNGSAAGGNIDVGLYSHEGVRLLSCGSVAGAGNNSLQWASVTETALSPGRYYLAMSCDDTTANRFTGMVSSASVGRMMGMLEMNSAFPLPAPATFAEYSSAIYPVCGITSLSSGL